MKPAFGKLLKSLISKGGKQILLITHKGADVDAIASAGAFYFLLSPKNQLRIAVPDHINLNAKAFAKNMKIPFSINEPFNPDFFDYIFIFDCSSKEMLSSYADFLMLEKTFVIDHHLPAEKLRSNSLVEAKEISTCSVIYRILQGPKIKPDKKVAECLAAGIITDSAGFTIADASVFSHLSTLLSISGKDYSEISALYESNIDISEKISMLKAAKRCRIFNCFGFIVALTEVDAFEASAAASLARLGADIAFAGGIKKGNLLISARAQLSFIKKTKFNIPADVFSKLEKQFNGSGGGHPGAASFNGSAPDAYAALERCLKETHKYLESFYGKTMPLKEY